VVLTADHGESLGEHGEATHGVFAYESTLRVPLVLHAPTLLAPRVVSAHARHVDLAPTILDAVGAPPERAMRGRSLMEVAVGQPDPDPPPKYFESLSPALNRGWAPLRGIALGSLKYIDLPIAELYDLASDPGEARNVVDGRPADAADLRQRLAAFADAGSATARRLESPDARERLRSLGYVSGATPERARYTAADDPKRLMGLDARLQEAVRLHTSGDHGHALVVARALVQERPDMRVAWMTLAQIQRDRRELDAAIVSMRRAHALGPQDPQSTSLLGAYLTERGQAVEAVALLSRAASVEQPDLQVLASRRHGREMVRTPSPRSSARARKTRPARGCWSSSVLSSSWRNGATRRAGRSNWRWRATRTWRGRTVRWRR
jgi:Flp pilus assembly protein TadD